MKIFQITITCTIVLFFIAPSMGQLSIQAGLNASSWQTSVEGFNYETDSKIGFHAGLNYMTPVSNKFHFKPGIFYTQKGAKLFEFTTSLDYLEFPLLFVYQPNTDKGFYGEGGLYLGFLLLAEEYNSTDVSDQYRSADTGLALGGGYDGGKVIIGIRGSLGLINLAKSDGTASEGKITNSNGQIYLAVKFP